MSEDEDDYMSANILAQCEKNDIKPGLIHSHAQKRLHTILKKKVTRDEENKRKNKPKRVLEEEKRNEGLNIAISHDNKGFALLQKMGYKPGTGIGKSGTGSVEPVPISVKCDRQGLGREAVLKEIQDEKLHRRAKFLKKRNESLNPESYRNHMVKKMEDRQNETDLRRSQRICQNLDDRMGVDLPAEKWFWPEKHEPEKEECNDTGDSEKTFEILPSDDEKDEDDEDEVGFDTADKLEMLTKYLRRSYYYCIWCGTEYDDEEDLKKNCPGTTRNDH